MKRLYLIALLLIVLSIGLSVSEAQITIQDSLGRTIVLESIPKRVVSLSPSITEMMAYVDELDRVIAADSQSMSGVWYKNASQALTARGAVDVGGYWWSAIDIEKILKLSPDVILADRGAHYPLLKVFEQYGLNVIYLNGGSSTSFNDILFDMNIVASVFGKENILNTLIDEAERAFNRAREIVQSNERKKMLIVIGIYGGIWIAGKGTFIDDVLSRIGIENAARAYSWSVVSIEKIAEWDPDVILVTPMGITDEMLAESGLNAFRDRLFVLNETEADILLRPGPLIIYSPEVLVKYYISPLRETPVTQIQGQEGHIGVFYMVGVFAVALLIGLISGKYLWRRA